MTVEAKRHAVDAAMSVAQDVAAGKLSAAVLDADAALEARNLFGRVVGPEDPLWPLQADVARQVIAAGGIPANELAEWLAVQRRRDGPETKPVELLPWSEIDTADTDLPYTLGGEPHPANQASVDDV